MKKLSCALFAFFLIVALVAPTLADTIRLKDGSVIRGQVIGFRDQQFTVLIGAGAKGRRGRTTVYIEDIESIEFDSATTAAATALANDDSSAGNREPAVQPTRTNLPADTSSPSSNTGQPISATPTFFTIKVAVHAKQCTGAARTGEVCAANGWSNTGLVVRQGQRLRISSSGRVSLGRGRFTTPLGNSTIPDNEKLMRNEATGALIAVIGDDNDDFILIGTRRDFVAQRDGVLFLGVNEGDLTDNTGSYDVAIEAEAGGSPR
ncbi:MAG: LecA/PA-IL family lectin [Pyrinomonadaceae bacterium]